MYVQIAEREGLALGTLLRRIIEDWALKYSLAEAAQVGEYLERVRKVPRLRRLPMRRLTMC